MKIFDKTPYRTASGEIDIMGRIRGTLSHGLNWYSRIQAQDAAIAIMGKVLGEKYTLLRNVTLVDTDIELPLVLVGPQGVFLINVTHERGVYRAKDDEWGTMRGDQFVLAAVNQVKRTLQLSRVLQVYLERTGLKDLLVEPVLMSADPGTHIESTRPAVRIIMSDALERFAISMAQGRASLSYEVTDRIVRTILNGPKKKDEPAPQPASAATPADSMFSDTQQEPSSSDYIFNEEPSIFQSDQPQSAGSQDMDFRDLQSEGGMFRDVDEPVSDSLDAGASAFDTPKPEARPENKSKRKSAPAKKKVFGLTTGQLGLIIGLLLFWLCSMIVFGAYIYFNLNG